MPEFPALWSGRETGWLSTGNHCEWTQPVKGSNTGFRPRFPEHLPFLMSLRLEMLQVARLAPQMLGDSAPLVESFVRSQRHASGGFTDRTGKPDVYYTVFGLDSLLALQADIDTALTHRFLDQVTIDASVDLVHLCCLARCWTAIDHRDRAMELLPRIERYRSADGGYSPGNNRPQGTVYGGFLAAGAYLDLGQQPPDPLSLVQSFKLLETPDHGWANEARMAAGSTNATAAAITLLRNLSMPVHQGVADWLLRQHHPQGGFVAAPGTPLPDLLSTATALHALSGLQINLGPICEPCLDFLDSLWTNEGSFHGHWHEDQLDVEYTFYGLLALGHLSIAADPPH